MKIDKKSKWPQVLTNPCLHISHAMLLLIELLRHCFSIELGFYMFVCIHVKVQDQVLLLRHLNDVAIISVVVPLHA